MVSFKATKILVHSEVLAEEFKKARRARGLGVPEAARKSQIGIKYIKAIEAGRLELLPAGIYRKNFLREYADFLGYDSRELLKNFPENDNDRETGNPFSCRVARTRTIIIPKIMRGIGVAAIAVVCLFYLQTRFSVVVSPPSLSIANPPEDMKLNSREINIIGTTDPETEVTINDNLVLTGVNGDFSKIINLREGINIITIIAKNKFGPEKKIVKQILVSKN
ncbi:MAG: helix-turn-helix domain-containing protein [Patescibacteria group bacterium]|jgi:cytoskeletal protein RodZ